MTAQQLKNSILQMAVQGKLVPQDPNDEPASVLLERIRAEKEKLIKEGKIKKEKNPSVIFRGEDNLPYEKVGKNEPVCIADEVPFEIPDSWEWVRCSTIGSMIRGKGIKRNETVKIGLPCVRYGEIYTTYDTEFTETSSYIPEEVDKNCNHFNYGDIIFTLTGENKPDIAKAVAYLGYKPVAAGGDLAYWTDHGMNPLFLVYYLNSPYSIEMKKRLATGDIIVHISTSKIGSFLLPVPPLTEQNRIVEKIKELVPHIEQYQRKLIFLDNLSTQFPEKIKKSILQEAVMGKLVPQDPNDEPASILLEKIRAEKNTLIKAGKLKKDKHESVIYRRDNSHYEKLDGVEHCIDDEIPFEIPGSWMWVRLKTIASVLGGKRIPAGRKLSSENTGHVYIRVSDMKNNSVNIDGLLYVPEDIYPSISRYIIRKEDLYITVAGTIGSVGKIPPELDGANLTENADRLVFSNINQDWFMWFLLSSLIQNQIADATTKVGQPKLAIKRIEDLLVALPPLKEQERIAIHITNSLNIINKL